MQPDDFNKVEVIQREEAPAAFKSSKAIDVDQCIVRRYRTLYKLDWRYRRFLWHIERFVEKMNEKERDAAWLCNDRTESSESFDAIGAAAFYHEGIHRLGSLFELQSGKHLSEFQLFTNREATGFTKMIYRKEQGLRPLYEIADELNAYRESYQLGLDLKNKGLQKQAQDNLKTQMKKLRKLYSGSKKQLCQNTELKAFLREQIREIHKSALKKAMSFSICN